MPAPLKTERIATLHHAELKTTFSGIEHPLSTAEMRIHQYRGIKYASIPARFRQSRLWTKFSSTTDATKHGPICPQIRNYRSVEETVLHLPPDAIPKVNLRYDEFECLNLTITCPAGATVSSRLPVMVWIHGGGDRGHGSNWLCDGGALVRKSMLMGKPVIIVAVNFRIGLFGFAASNQLREDNKAAGDDGVGNYGLRDQRKAMEWLHAYIGGFGGDPDNVTLFGISTGAADIVCHLLSKENDTRPLFNRAIIQSAILDPIQSDVSTAGWHLSRIMGMLLVPTIKELRSVECEKLLGLGSTFRAVDDGFFFRQGWKAFFGDKVEERPKHRATDERLLHPPVRNIRVRSVSHHVRSRSRSSHAIATPMSSPAAPRFHQPLIIGDCSCDSLLWSVPAFLWTSVAVVRRLRAVCQTLSKSNNLMRAYDITPYTPDNEIVDHVLDLINDTRIAWPTEIVAENAKRERGGQGVWRYVFDQESPSRGTAHHAADLVYLFDNVPLDVCSHVSTAVNVVESSPKTALTPASTAIATPQGLPKSTVLHPVLRGRTLKDSASDGTDFDEDIFFDDSDSDESITTLRTEDDFDWMRLVVDEWSYSRVRDTMQEKWIAFAHGDSPWKEDKVFVFGPEGETGERSMSIFEGRRRRHLWQEVLEPLGVSLAQKIGLELSRGPSINGGR